MPSPTEKAASILRETARAGEPVPKDHGLPEGFVSFEHMYLLTYIQLADSKASVFLAMTSGALAYIFGRYGFAWLSFRDIGSHMVVLLVAMALLALSAAYAFAVIVPRLGNPVRSIIHFRSVVRLGSARDYADDIIATPRREMFEQQIAWCYDLARVCARKYRLLDMSLWLGVVGYGAFLAALTVL